MKRILTIFLVFLLTFGLTGCGNNGQQHTDLPVDGSQPPQQSDTLPTEVIPPDPAIPEEFVRISGGTFQMGSLESEAWRIEDETAHMVTC